jgi:hypothetical protein
VMLQNKPESHRKDQQQGKPHQHPDNFAPGRG